MPGATATFFSSTLRKISRRARLISCLDMHDVAISLLRDRAKMPTKKEPESVVWRL